MASERESGPRSSFVHEDRTVLTMFGSSFGLEGGGVEGLASRCTDHDVDTGYSPTNFGPRRAVSIILIVRAEFLSVSEFGARRASRTIPSDLVCVQGVSQIS